MNAEYTRATGARVRKHPKLLWGAFAIVAAVLLFQITITSLLGPGLTGYATQGYVGACINTPPNLTIPCTQYAFVSTPYSCQANGTHPYETNLTYTVARIAGPVIGDPLFVMNGSWLNFTAGATQAGNYTLLFTVNDGHGCANSITSAVFDVQINQSQFAPFLAVPIPGQQWNAGTVLVPFDLDDHFVDPNNDPLAYSVTGNVNIAISITTGQVTLTPATSWCGIETVFFTATDPTNLSAISNPVQLNVTCPTPPSQPATTSAASSGGGGGGGGGGSGGGSGGSNSITALNSCSPSYLCYDWSACQLTQYVTYANGTINKLQITGVRGSAIYNIAPNASTDPNAYYEGFQWRQCIDTRQCLGSDVDIQVRSCSYTPNCQDGIKNQNETGIDCGGVCGPCSSCSDGIQNGLEEGVDCGGPFCASCATCSDGKMDGTETGVDCGGGSCPSCGTCFDGVANGLETGVDCGGPFCNACIQEQLPLGGMPWLTITLVVLVILALLFLALVTLKHQLASFLMKLVLSHKRKNRRILIPSNLKAEIIRRLAELEAKAPKQPMLRNQEELAGIIRDYFRGALGLHFEFTNEELVIALDQSKLNPLLQSVLERFFVRINVLEFSGLTVAPVVFTALIQETREVVYQTAVLTVDDLREREHDLAIRDIPIETPSLDKGYLLLSEVQLAIQFDKLELANAIYAVLDTWYARTAVEEQRVIYDDLIRVYDELRLAHGAEDVTAVAATMAADIGGGSGVPGNAVPAGSSHATPTVKELEPTPTMPPNSTSAPGNR